MSHSESPVAVRSIYLGNDPGLANYHLDIYTQVIVGLAQKQKPQIVLLGSTSVGRELAPLVAAGLETGLTAHCTDLCINSDKILEQVIPAYGGEITIICPEKRPQMATVAQGVFPMPVSDETRMGEIVPIAGPFKHTDRVEILEVVMEEPPRDAII